MTIEAIELTKFTACLPTAIQEAIDLSARKDGTPVRFAYQHGGPTIVVDRNSSNQYAGEYYELARQRESLGIETPEILIPGPNKPLHVVVDTGFGLLKDNVLHAIQHADTNQQMVSVFLSGVRVVVAPGDRARLDKIQSGYEKLLRDESSRANNEEMIAKFFTKPPMFPSYTATS